MRDEPKMFLTLNEALREFPGLSVRGFYKAVADQQIQVYRFDSWRRVHRDDVRAWIAGRRRPSGAREEP
jgi:hypothetical protein